MRDLFGDEGYSGLERSALISTCDQFRYWLRREYRRGGDGREVCFVMLNPSRADADRDDPTVRRCLGFVRSWGFSSLVVRNLFAYRATNPAHLLAVTDPIGPRNDEELLQCRWSDLIVAAWGASVPFARDRKVLELLSGVPFHCIGRTKGGRPRHPLYAPASSVPVPFLF